MVLNLPSPQSEHDTVPFSEVYFPWRHWEHVWFDEAPMVVLYRPAGQLVHDAVPGTLEYFPAAQRTYSSRTRSSSSQHPNQLHDYLDGTHSEPLKRSPLGLTRVYNQLPADVVAASTVSRFQRQLQE